MLKNVQSEINKNKRKIAGKYPSRNNMSRNNTSSEGEQVGNDNNSEIPMIKTVEKYLSQPTSSSQSKKRMGGRSNTVDAPQAKQMSLEEIEEIA